MLSSAEEATFMPCPSVESRKKSAEETSKRNRRAEKINRKFNGRLRFQLIRDACDVIYQAQDHKIDSKLHLKALPKKDTFMIKFIRAI